jgi:hypothetical protein
MAEVGRARQPAPSRRAVGARHVHGRGTVLGPLHAGAAALPAPGAERSGRTAAKRPALSGPPARNRIPALTKSMRASRAVDPAGLKKFRSEIHGGKPRPHIGAPAAWRRSGIGARPAWDVLSQDHGPGPRNFGPGRIPTVALVNAVPRGDKNFEGAVDKNGEAGHIASRGDATSRSATAFPLLPGPKRDRPPQREGAVRSAPRGRGLRVRKSRGGVDTAEGWIYITPPRWRHGSDGNGRPACASLRLSRTVPGRFARVIGRLPGSVLGAPALGPGATGHRQSARPCAL